MKGEQDGHSPKGTGIENESATSGSVDQDGEQLDAERRDAY